MKIWDKTKALAKRVFCKAPVPCVAVVGGLTVIVSNTAHAQSLDLTGVAVDTAPVFTMALIVITGLAALWAIWKTISLIRSR